MAAGYRVVAATPSVGDYVRLREEAGLSPKSRAAAERGLAGTWFAAYVLDADDAVVGMGRIVGDGGCFFQVVDVAVAPPHQRRGLGRRIMQALVRRLEAQAPAGAYVSLLADGDARFLYEQFGFEETAPASVGMARRF